MGGWRYRFLAPMLALCTILTPQAGLALDSPAPSPGHGSSAQGRSTTDVLDALNQSLKSENETLKTLNEILRAENEALKQENALLRSQLEAAQKQIQELQVRPAAAESKTVQELAERLSSQVFRVDIFDYGGRLIGNGSAVAVTATDVVTNYHVVQDAWKAELVTQSGARFPVLGMTAFNQSQDLALLRVSGPLEPVTRRTTPVKTGEEVVAIGSPIGLINTVSTGIVSAVRNMNGMEVIQVSAPISPGSSGGGLFDRQGNLIGVTSAVVEGGQNLNFAIPVRYVEQLMAQVGAPQDLPGVHSVTPENLPAVLQQSYSVLELNGYQIGFQYETVLEPHAGAGDTFVYTAMIMDRDEYFRFASAMLTGHIDANVAAVEDFVLEVAQVVDLAYPNQDVMVVLVHFGEYRIYPEIFDYTEIEYDPTTESWWVFHPELMVWEWDGEWFMEWVQ